MVQFEAFIAWKGWVKIQEVVLILMNYHQQIFLLVLRIQNCAAKFPFSPFFSNNDLDQICLLHWVIYDFWGASLSDAFISHVTHRWLSIQFNSWGLNLWFLSATLKLHVFEKYSLNVKYALCIDNFVTLNQFIPQNAIFILLHSPCRMEHRIHCNAMKRRTFIYCFSSLLCCHDLILYIHLCCSVTSCLEYSVSLIHVCIYTFRWPPF